MKFRLVLQLAEAFGNENRWFCSRAYEREITDQELLLKYYIKSGGAADFERRFNQAMGDTNRWYCSIYYGHDIRDPKILWEYYMEHFSTDAERDNPEDEPDDDIGGLNIAC